MAKPTKLPSGKYRIQVLINGERLSSTFNTSSEAKAWAARRQFEAQRQSETGAKNVSLWELSERWYSEIGVKRLQAGREKKRLAKLLEDTSLGKTKLPLLDKVAVNAWKRERCEEVTDATVRREWGLLSRVCQDGIDEFGWLSENPFRQAKRPPKPPARTVMPTDEIMDKLIYCMGDSRIKWATLFAAETGLSAGEICDLTWNQVKGNLVHLPKFKTRPARIVPLTPEAQAVLKEMNSDTPTVFNLTRSSLDALFRKYRKKAGVGDVHFHDLRARAATKLSKKVDPFELAKILGHKDLEMIVNVYYRESAENIALSTAQKLST